MLFKTFRKAFNSSELYRNYKKFSFAFLRHCEVDQNIWHVKLTSTPGVFSLKENLQNSVLLLSHSVACVAFLLGPKLKALKCREKKIFLGLPHPMKNGAVRVTGGESSPSPLVPPGLVLAVCLLGETG